jgi:phosphomannomutase/phosphoglucomutase
LLALAAGLAFQGWSTRQSSNGASAEIASLETLAKQLRKEMTKQAETFRAATVQATGDPVSDLALIRTQMPKVRDVRWWDRTTLDAAYRDAASVQQAGYARLAGAENVLVSSAANAAQSRFARPPQSSVVAMVLSARHGDKVIQAWGPADALLASFTSSAPSSLPVVLLQDGRVVTAHAGGEDLDLTAADVSVIGGSALALAYRLAPEAMPWMGSLSAQLATAGLLLVLSLFVLLGPVLRSRVSSRVPSKKRRATSGQGEVSLPSPTLPSPQPRLAPVMALPASMRASSSEEAPLLPASAAPVPVVPPGWFIDEGVQFLETEESPLPDSSQVRALARALVEQLPAGPLLLVPDGRTISQSVAKWAAEGLAAAGMEVITVEPLPLSAMPAAQDFATYVERPVASVLWVGSNDEAPGRTGLRVFQEGQAWSTADYARWRLRLSDPIVPPPAPEASISALDISSLLSRQVQRVALLMQVERPIRIVADFGNGALGAFAPDIWEGVGIEVVPLHADLDPEFPNRPARAPSGWASLASTVRQFHADFGVGVSLDGTCLSLVDELGTPVPGFQCFALLASDALERQPGARVEFDPHGMGEDMPHAIQRAGGIPLPNADLSVFQPLAPGVALAGKMVDQQMTYRFQEDQGIPNAIYAVARLAVLLSSQDQVLSLRLSDVMSS